MFPYLKDKISAYQLALFIYDLLIIFVKNIVYKSKDIYFFEVYKNT